MVMRNAGRVKAPGELGGKPHESAGWRPSRDRERLSPGIWIASFVLAGGVIALMAALFGVT